MTLQDFENQIDSKILKRGKEYFNNDCVEFLEETKKGYWTANVSGTDEYTVEIQLDSKENIKKCFCDCPYDYGDICKHIVAVLYAISEDKIMDITPKPVSKAKEPKVKKTSFNALLSKIELKEYQDFIKQYSQINKNFKDQFELYFSEKNESFDLKKKYVDIIKSVIKKHTSRGFIDYSASNKLGKELNQYLDVAKEYLSKNNYRDATVLFQIIIKEVIKVVEYCDDSNGYVVDNIDEAISNLTEMVNTPVSFEFKEKIADFLKEELKKKIYFDYGNFGYDLTETYAAFCIKTDRKDEFLQFLDLKIQSAKDDDYDRSFFIKEKISFLSRIGSADEAKKIIKQNLDISEIRNLEIDRKIENQDYEAAKKLISEGIKIAEAKRHSGTVFQYEKKLLAIAVLEKDIQLERYFSRKFALDRTLDSAYYNQWKNTYSKEEWTQTIEEVIVGITKKVTEKVRNNTFSNGNSVNVSLLYSLGSIYIQENYWDRLLTLVQKQENLTTILTYYPHLLKAYPNELLDILIPVLEREGDKSEGRSQYKDLANKMKSIMKDYPQEKERILEIAQKLKIKYPRRPAMLEELNKLF